MIIDSEYSLINTEALPHKKLIGLMKDRSDSFMLVSPNESFVKGASEEILDDICPSLKEYCISRQWVNKWAGTKSGRKAPACVFSMNEKSADYLKRLGSLFALKDQTDISFFSGELCLCYTVSHEGMCFVRTELLKELN